MIIYQLYLNKCKLKQIYIQNNYNKSNTYILYINTLPYKNLLYRGILCRDININK